MCIRDRVTGVDVILKIKSKKALSALKATIKPTAKVLRFSSPMPVSYTHLDVYKRQK